MPYIWLESPCGWEARRRLSSSLLGGIIGRTATWQEEIHVELANPWWRMDMKTKMKSIELPR